MSTLLWLVVLAPIALLWAWALGIALEGIGQEIKLLIREIAQ